uniref:Uncharacterized protein n=1 Tax=Molossus molossus TaxID=27622 RepID=A0A7J8JWD6_MOLMO|nr:hypothetical protein HJG59_008059 [Molossus molossus]
MALGAMSSPRGSSCASDRMGRAQRPDLVKLSLPAAIGRGTVVPLAQNCQAAKCSNPGPWRCSWRGSSPSLALPCGAEASSRSPLGQAPESPELISVLFLKEKASCSVFGHRGSESSPPHGQL